MRSGATQRLAVIDLGSNSFRLVVFTATEGWWQRTDEIYQPVRIGEGMAATGRLGEEPMRRAEAALDVFDHFCRAAGLLGERAATHPTGAVDAVATSAIREAENAAAFLTRARAHTSLPIRVLSREQEAWYGYLAAVNSTTLSEGCALDLGGGSLQVVEVHERLARRSASWRLGAVRMTERFIPNGAPPKRRQLEELRAHIAQELRGAPWLSRADRNEDAGRNGDRSGRHSLRSHPQIGQPRRGMSPGFGKASVSRIGRRLVGIGGTVRSLASVAQRAAGLPDNGVQGAVVTRAALGEIVTRLAALPTAERACVPGVKPARADLILAGAVVVEGVMAAGGFEELEATEAGLREGVFFERQLSKHEGPDRSRETLASSERVGGVQIIGQPADGRLRHPHGDPAHPANQPLFADVRRASVLNLAARYGVDRAHTGHVAELALGMFDQLARLGLHGGDPVERELLWAACWLHDIGMSVDYDDHHKHSRYLILNAGLPGYSQTEAAIVAQAARYHRKGLPEPGPLAALFAPGDAERLDRCAVLLRLAEDLERSRDQIVRDTRLSAHNGTVRLQLVADGALAVPRWAAGRESELFARAFHRDLTVVA